MHFSKMSFIGSLLFVLTASASPLAHLNSLASEVEEALSNKIVLEPRQECSSDPVVGIDDGAILARPNVYDMEQDGDLWNIYILGLLRMQDRDQQDPLSYYRIAAIHSRPFGRSYDGIEPIFGNTGWATHTSNIFFIWHRVYTALFEQVLYTNVQEVVETFEGEDRERYEGALGRFRCPWWDPTLDPTADRPVYPPSMASPRMLVRTPEGEEEVRNPLYSYVFHPPGDELGREPWSTYETTLRAPTSGEPDAVSRNSRCAEAFERNQESFKARMHDLFTNYRDYNQFSNAAWIEDNLEGADSAESVHNVIHGIVGSGGHMTFLDVGSFDPAFFWVHANTDRWIAMYQNMWPDTYIEPMEHEGATSSIRPGETTDVDTELMPFSANGQCERWTSRGARYTQPFGYTYEHANGNTRRMVNDMYGPTEEEAPAPRLVRRNETESYDENPDYDVSNNDTSASSYKTPGAKIRDYYVTIKSTKFTLDGSYFLFAFLGEPGDDPSDWAIDENLVGTHCVLAPIDQSEEHKEKHMLVAGSIPLTKALSDAVEADVIDSLDEKDVAPYLRENLHWRMTKAKNDEVIDPQTVPDLRVTVGSIVVRNPFNYDDLPERETEFEKLTEATSGKPAGSCEEDVDD